MGRAVGKVSHGGASGGGGNDRCPVQPGIEFLRPNLQDDQHKQEREEQRRSGEVSPIQCHGHGIAAGLAQRRRRDLDDPEDQCDFGNLARGSFKCTCHLTSVFSLHIGIREEYKLADCRLHEPNA